LKEKLKKKEKWKDQRPAHLRIITFP
jgi:hypothetical protein